MGSNMKTIKMRIIATVLFLPISESGTITELVVAETGIITGVSRLLVAAEYMITEVGEGVTVEV